MNLAQLPNLTLALMEIMWDQPYPTVNGRNLNVLDMQAEIPSLWERKCAITEMVLLRLSSYTAKDLSFKSECCLPDESLVLLVAMGCNDEPELAMKEFGVPEAEREIVGDVLNEYFDGDLRYVFQPQLKERK